MTFTNDNKMGAEAISPVCKEFQADTTGDSCTQHLTHVGCIARKLEKNS